jgi:hypothetical protein
LPLRQEVKIGNRNTHQRGRILFCLSHEPVLP